MNTKSMCVAIASLLTTGSIAPVYNSFPTDRLEPLQLMTKRATTLMVPVRDRFHTSKLEGSQPMKNPAFLVMTPETFQLIQFSNRGCPVNLQGGGTR